MELPPKVNYYDLSFRKQFEIFDQVAISSESVQGAGPDAEKEGHIQEGDPGLMDDIHHEGDQEGSIGHEGDIDHEGHGNHESRGGDQEPGQQLAEMAQVAAAAAPQRQNRQPQLEGGEFTPVQVRELESIYEHTQDPDWFTGRIIARRIGDTEDRVQGDSAKSERSFCTSCLSKLVQE